MQIAIGWAAAGLAIHLALVGAFLVRANGDPSWFLHLGERSRALPVARAVFGSSLLIPHRDDGHDGKAFWLIARDPLLRDERLLATYLNRPVYRAQRIAYPALASIWRLGGERALLWGMVATNLMVVFAGGLAAAFLASHIGAPARASLAFALCPGVAAATLMDLGDTLASAALLGALLSVVRGRTGWAIASGVLAVLAKEPMMLGLAGIALLAPRVPRRTRALLVLVPGMAALAWGIYARWRLGWPPSDIPAAFSAPFRGYAEALRLGWRPGGNWANAAVALALLPLAGLVIGRWLKRRSLLLSTAVPFVCVLPFLGEQVLEMPFNSIRAVAPVITLLAIDLYAPRTVTTNPLAELIEK